MAYRRIMTPILTALCTVVLLLSLRNSLQASPNHRVSRGQTVYVSVYSNIFSAPKMVPYNLAALLSIRNTDMSNPIRVTGADYYDTRGRLLRQYYQQPVTLAPLESVFIFVPEEDTKGGVGANFIVRWSSAKDVNTPIIECVMIGMKSGQGISFVSQGQEIKDSQ